MNDNDMPEKSDIQLKYYKFGVNIPVPTIRLSDKHLCNAVYGMTGIQMFCSVRSIAV